jgi:hypothetical protein
VVAETSEIEGKRPMVADSLLGIIMKPYNVKAAASEVKK